MKRITEGNRAGRYEKCLRAGKLSSRVTEHDIIIWVRFIGAIEEIRRIVGLKLAQYSIRRAVIWYREDGFFHPCREYFNNQRRLRYLHMR